MSATDTPLSSDPALAADPRHLPVMLDEVVEALGPRPGAVIVDGTFGAGGYTRALLAAGATVVAIDRDPTAIAAGRALEAASEGRLTLVHGRFADLDTLAQAAGHPHVDGVVLDVGVSSMQLDEAERGFSFRFDGPLDMRMGQHGPTAADLVNGLEGKQLTRLIGLYGDERRASAISRAIVARREERPFERTLDLAAVVEKVVRRAGDAIHPATRTFQALRIAVNRELDELADALAAAERLLVEGGRLVVVAFHSLEDRIVKRFFADRSRERAGGSRHLPEEAIEPPTFRLPYRAALSPGDAEVARNPRARSAHLRTGERTAAPARPIDVHALGVPSVSISSLGG
ncbi:16S rRNA (cytosine(1402)-N(4))-methyltransferase RsmH [Pseudoxanthobacter sp. M-2]|uniref:16S rRNA (cytosine(1402)-N(4))-methyltransferase RsmH n=1 Tax=Pseudoxanthobacter sp. M-2 TaxID=3078754 RepID=UPI0038FC0FEF